MMKEEHPLLKYFEDYINDEKQPKKAKIKHLSLFINIILFIFLLGVVIYIFNLFDLKKIKDKLTYSRFDPPKNISSSVKSNQDFKQNINPTVQNISPNSQEIIYKNKYYNYSIIIPKKWEGKYEIRENDKTTEFYFSENQEKKESILAITAVLKNEWKEIEKQEVYHGEKISENDNLVFIYTHRLDNPYSISDSSENKKLADGYQEMFMAIPELIDSFRFE